MMKFGKTAPIANDFIELRPSNGKAENPDFKTEAKVAYDDTGIYVSAMMYDKEPSKIGERTYRKRQYRK